MATKTIQQMDKERYGHTASWNADASGPTDQPAAHTLEPHTVPWHEHWHAMEVLRLQRDELVEALRECIEGFRDTAERDGGTLYQKANNAQERARTLLARVEAK